MGGISGAFGESYNANILQDMKEGSGCVDWRWHCAGQLVTRGGRKGGKCESLEEFGGGRILPVLQFPRHALGEASTDQPDQEQHAHAERDHQQDVVLGGRGHHLHGQVGEAFCWRHLQARQRRAAAAAGSSRGRGEEEAFTFAA